MNRSQNPTRRNCERVGASRLSAKNFSRSKAHGRLARHRGLEESREGIPQLLGLTVEPLDTVLLCRDARLRPLSREREPACDRRRDDCDPCSDPRGSVHELERYRTECAAKLAADDQIEHSAPGLRRIPATSYEALANGQVAPESRNPTPPNARHTTVTLTRGRSPAPATRRPVRRCVPTAPPDSTFQEVPVPHSPRPPAPTQRRWATRSSRASSRPSSGPTRTSGPEGSRCGSVRRAAGPTTRVTCPAGSS